MAFPVPVVTTEVLVEPPDVIVTVSLPELLVAVEDGLERMLERILVMGGIIPLLDDEVADSVPDVDVADSEPVDVADPEPLAVADSEAVDVTEPDSVAVAVPEAVVVAVSEAVIVAVPDWEVSVTVAVTEALSEELPVEGFRIDESHEVKGSPGVDEADEAAVVVTEGDDVAESLAVVDEPLDAVPVPVADPESVEVAELEPVEAVSVEVAEPLTESVPVAELVAESVADEAADVVVEEPVVDGFKTDDSQDDNGSTDVEVEVTEVVVERETDVGVSVMDAELVDVVDIDPEAEALVVVESDVVVAEADPEAVDERDDEPVNVTDADVDDEEVVVELAATREVIPSPAPVTITPMSAPAVDTTPPKPSPRSPKALPTPPGEVCQKSLPKINACVSHKKGWTSPAHESMQGPQFPESTPCDQSRPPETRARTTFGIRSSTI